MVFVLKVYSIYCAIYLTRVGNRDFLGEDQNDKKSNVRFYFGTSIKAGKSIKIMMAWFKKLAEQ